MSRRSIRKIIAKARRNSFRGLKQQIRGSMWVDDITVNTHLAVFSDEYMRLFWSHLITGCTFLRRLGTYDGATKIHMNVRADDAIGLITAYDEEVRRCEEVVSKAIREALAEAVALEIALATAQTVAGDIITRYGIDIEATDAGNQRVRYSVSLRRDPFFETEFWASMEEFNLRLMKAVRSLEHQERISFHC